MNEIEALQNAANNCGLTIHEWQTQDKRKTTKKYFAQTNNQTVSPILDYENMNCFLLGWIKCVKIN